MYIVRAYARVKKDGGRERERECGRVGESDQRPRTGYRKRAGYRNSEKRETATANILLFVSTHSRRTFQLSKLRATRACLLGLL